jgi:type I site-specific restriction endonuclease
MARQAFIKPRAGASSTATIGMDDMLAAAGWAVQDDKAFDPSAYTGIALREVPLKSGRYDYLLLVNRKPVGVVEAKKEGVTLSTVAERSAHYAANLPNFLAAGLGSDSLPFRYESTGVETFFGGERDSHPILLIQMATGSGKTFTAFTQAYRRIKHADAKLIHFLMDRAKLGRQANTEFDQSVLADDGRKFTAVYNVQHLTSSVRSSVSLNN